MEPDEALATLLRAALRELPLSNEEMKDAQTLIKELGFLAVALVQAGTYCHQFSSHDRDISHPYTFTQYLLLFHTHRAELMKKAQPSPLDNYERGVYTTLDLSYQALPPRCRDFLHFLSFFHHTDIPLAALAKATKNDFIDEWSLFSRPEDYEPVLKDLADLLGAENEWNGFQVQETISKLRSFSLVSSTSITNDIFLQMHPLVQAWSRDMVSSISQHYRSMVMQVLTSCNGDKALLLHRYVLPHALDILRQVEIQGIHVNGLMGVAAILRNQGYYRKATGLVEVALVKMTDSGEQSAEKTLLVTAWLATLYWEDGRGEEAEKLQVVVLEQRKSVLGMEHPDTVKAAANLAATYWRQGRDSEAEKLDADVLEQRERILGMEHPDTILAAANLAAIYRSQGRWNEAEKLETEVLKQRKRILGMEHPHTMQAAANLAATYQSQGRLSEAEKLDVDVLEQRKRILGMEHPDTIRAAASLAVIYHSQGRWGEAETLELEVLEQRKRLLGLEHPSTILAASNLAVTYYEQGGLEEAVNLLAPAVDLGVKVLGRQHPHTQHSARCLALVYEKLGREEAATETRVLLLS